MPSGRLIQTRRTNNRHLPYPCTKFLRNALFFLPEAAKNDILVVDFSIVSQRRLRYNRWRKYLGVISATRNWNELVLPSLDVWWSRILGPKSSLFDKIDLLESLPHGLCVGHWWEGSNHQLSDCPATKKKEHSTSINRQNASPNWWAKTLGAI